MLNYLKQSKHIVIRSGANYAMAYAVEKVLEELLVYKKKEGKVPGEILLLGRYAFDGDRLERSGLFEYVY